ncbi:MAG: hypothetical protein OXP69_08200 [Spirochaetaceae bacterium]|nr:hypothetical protein [Spirochaetaceae bacterium]
MIDRWFYSFRESPVQAVSDLFSGRAGVGSNLRLDVPELLYQAFPPTLVEERAELDEAMFSWLLGMREDYATHVQSLGFAVYGKRIGDALITLQLLDLPHARDRIRADLDVWLRWLTPLRLAPERDPALECYRLLTRGQPKSGHPGIWLRLATDPRSEYLAVALEGLQLLPNQNDAQRNQTLMLQALLRYAVNTHHQATGARTFFNRRYAALRGLFPRSPQHWRRVLAESLSAFREHTQSKLAQELVELVGSNPQYSSRGRNPSIVPVAQPEWEDLQANILSEDDQPDVLAQRLFELLERNHRYAEATGVSHFFVRTLHNLGNSLLERYQLDQEDMTRLGRMIERALIWEPKNPYCWMLWADWFQAQGQRNAREWTLREMVRLFPNDAHGRVELSRLLIDRGEMHWDEAELWLRKVMQHYPDSEHSRAVWARLLALRGRATEAEATLAKLVRRHPAGQTAREALERLRAGVYSGQAAHDDSHANQMPASLPKALNELIRRGRIGSEFNQARIRGSVTRTEFIRAETLKGDQLAGFYSQWLMPKETPECPPYAWAWNACRYWQESAGSDGWLDLSLQFPAAAPETEFLRILSASRDVENQSEIARWCKQYDTDNDESTARGFMSEALKRVSAMSPEEREESALTVLACGAADAVEFVTEQAA